MIKINHATLQAMNYFVMFYTIQSCTAHATTTTTRRVTTLRSQTSWCALFTVARTLNSVSYPTV